MAFDPDAFRQVLRRFGSGVTVITAGEDGQTFGATASAFCSLSINPAFILVCLDLKSNTKAVIDRTQLFGVNILSDRQRPVSDLFARKTMAPEDIAAVPKTLTEGGVPHFTDCLAFLECKVQRSYPGGDHDIYVGEILSAAYDAKRRPLLYYDGQYRRLGGQM